MMKTGSIAWIAAFMVICHSQAFASKRFYPDREAVSENGRYRIEARSPDNEGGQNKKPFASRFEYRLTDTASGKVLWSERAGPDDSACSGLFVDNDGWTIIHSAWDDLTYVSPRGRKTGGTDILEEGLTEQERSEYVHDTTAGPMWRGCSLWYPLKAGNLRLFVIRPWWGKRIVTDVEKGVLIDPAEPIQAACSAYEKGWVLKQLRDAVDTREKWDGECCPEEAFAAVKASFWAGKLGVAESLPMLKALQDSPYIGSSTSGFGAYKPGDGGVDPSGWRTFTLRRVVHQSLRRLGARPEPFPCTQFRVRSGAGKEEDHRPPANEKRPRDKNEGDIKEGMKPEEVLELIGSPDFNDTDEWYYDIDGLKSFTLTITWGEKGVASVSRNDTPGWKTDRWDREIAY